jgi:hypothetical protein
MRGPWIGSPHPAFPEDDRQLYFPCCNAEKYHWRAKENDVPAIMVKLS